MNHDDASGAVAMRMCVLFSRAAVCGPACVADAVRAIKRIEANRLFQVAQLSFGAANLEIVSFIDDSNAGRVVAAIFEFAQPIDNERHDLFVAYVTNNSTHVWIWLLFT